MNQTAIDYGQAQITAFSNAAAAGEIRYEPDVARQAAAEYQKVIIGLQEIRTRLQTVADPQGFGGFQSSTELQQGFAQKTVDGLAVLNQLIEGAMTLQEAYLRSGNLITEADQTNAMLTQFVADNSGLGEP
ncbi:hypothetical protein [Nocardia rhamnosiphila]|uniref:hypothetical protein n=1 Tax=Nocardia rhamnosiphila TaxID=426716 RepID=UPI0004C36CE1|nr:hypothetical protein [Nocardia rhamnosiphila]